MPVSKRPRRTHRKVMRPASSLTVVTPQVQSNLRGEFRNLETSLRLNLPAGAVPLADLARLEDAFNAFGFAVVHRRETEGREFLFEMLENREAIHDFLVAKAAYHAYASRRQATGMKAAKGDELKAIFKGFDVVFPFIDESFERCPRLMVKEIMKGRLLGGVFNVEER